MMKSIIPNVLYHSAIYAIMQYIGREVISSVSQWIRMVRKKGKTRMKRMEKKLKKLPKKIDFLISTDYLLL